jgi:PASTA domain-containing protein
MSGRLTIAVAAGLLMVAAATVSAAALDGLTVAPNEALAGTSVVVEPDFKFAQGCDVSWDGAPVLSAADCGSAFPLTVTASGAPGTHTVVLCTAVCDGSDAVTESAEFLVDQAVPAVSGLPLGEARSTLAAAGLGATVTRSADPQDTVIGSVPSAGAGISPGGTVQLVASVPLAVHSEPPTSTDGRSTISSSPSVSVSSPDGPTSRHSIGTNVVLPAPPNRNTAWPVVGGASLAALLVLAALTWWLRRHAVARAGRHARPHEVAAPARVYVTPRDARVSVRLDRDPRPPLTVDVHFTRRTTVELTKEVGDAN